VLEDGGIGPPYSFDRPSSCIRQVSCVPRRLYELSVAAKGNSGANKSPSGTSYKSDDDIQPLYNISPNEKASPGGGRRVRSMRVGSYGSHGMSSDSSK